MKKIILGLLLLLTSCTTSISKFQNAENFINRSVMHDFQSSKDGKIYYESKSIENYDDDTFIAYFDEIAAGRAVSLLRSYQIDSNISNISKMESSEIPYPEYNFHFERLNKNYNRYYSIWFKKNDKDIKDLAMELSNI